MPTLAVTALGYERSDGSRTVVIRLCHNRQLGYMKTKYSVHSSKVRNGKITDGFLIDRLNTQVKKCRDEILKLEDSIYGYTAGQPPMTYH